MELRTYLQILVKRWWIVVAVFLITVAFTALFTFSEAPIFSATSTFIVSPSDSSLDARGILSGLDVLSNKSQIANTYAEIATSDLIEQEAAAALSLDPALAKSFVVKTKMRGATNVIEIAVDGGDPALIADYANKIGERTVAFVKELAEVYDLKALDPAKPPDAPVRPNKLLNLILGSIFGLALGVGLALLVDYLRRPVAAARQAGVPDNESGA